jgi:hypothetical protein
VACSIQVKYRNDVLESSVTAPGADGPDRGPSHRARRLPFGVDGPGQFVPPDGTHGVAGDMVAAVAGHVIRKLKRWASTRTVVKGGESECIRRRETTKFDLLLAQGTRNLPALDDRQVRVRWFFRIPSPFIYPSKSQRSSQNRARLPTLTVCLYGSGY